MIPPRPRRTQALRKRSSGTPPAGYRAAPAGHPSIAVPATVRRVNILIVKLTALGDITHTLPALTTLRRTHPQAHLTWLVEDSAQDLLRDHPALDRLLVWPRRHWRKLFRTGHWLALAQAVASFRRQLRETRFDLAIDFQGLVKSALWIAQARATTKAGYGPGQRHDEFAWLALDRRIPVRDPGAHAVERNLRLLDALGFPRLPLAFDFPTPEARRQEALMLLAESGIPHGSPFVAVNAMTRWPTKNWTADHFARTADLIRAAGLPVVFTGAPGDRSAIDDIFARMKERAVRLDGKTSLQTLGAIFRDASVVLSTDTGPMHIAVAVGTPVVALFGPTSPEYTGPYGSQNTVIRAGLPCSPCFRRVCRTRDFEPHACMRRLDPADVARAVLARVPPRPAS